MVLPTVLSVSPTSSDFAPSVALDLTGLSPADLRQTSHGWYAVLRLRDCSHRLWLKELPVPGTPQAIEMPLDSSFNLRNEAAHSLWRALNGRAPGPPLHGLPRQRRQRLALVLRALDGNNENNSYREIAEGLFGKERVPTRGWKTCDLRNRTIRLVQQGLALMQGGYRELLRPRRRND